MQVRAAALRRFGENNIREGAPLATMEDVLVPIYMLHRYQVEAASKLIGGMDYTFALRGDGQTPTQIVAASEQRRALAAVLATLKPEALQLPESLLKMISAAANGSMSAGANISRFGRILHSMRWLRLRRPSATHAAVLFNPDTRERLIEFHARDHANPGLGEVARRCIESNLGVSLARRDTRVRLLTWSTMSRSMILWR